MKVKEVMKKAITLGSEDTIKEAASLMSKKNIGSLIVVENDLIVGIVTERDIMKHISQTNCLDSKVEEIMIPSVITIDSNASLEEAADSMFQHKIKKLPVTENGKLVGILSATEIIANADCIDEPFFF
jgi:CBS domain-containing protein